MQRSFSSLDKSLQGHLKSSARCYWPENPLQASKLVPHASILDRCHNDTHSRQITVSQKNGCVAKCGLTGRELLHQGEQSSLSTTPSTSVFFCLTMPSC